MPRDNDKETRRPPGKRGPPSRGKDGGQRSGRDKRPGGGFRKDGEGFKPREARAGGSFRKGRDEAPRGTSRPFGDKRGGGKGFGEKRSFAKAGSFRKDGDRPARRDVSRDDRPKREFPRQEGGGGARPRGDAPRAFRKDGDRPPRRDFKSEGERPSRREFSRDERPKRDFGGRDRPDGERRPRTGAPGGFRKDGDRPPRRDFKSEGERPPRREFSRDDRPKREFGDRARSGSERAERRPSSDAPGGFRKDGDRPPRRDFKNEGERPPRREFSRDDRPKREFGDRARSGSERAERRPSSDAPGGFRKDGDRPPRRDFKRDGDRSSRSDFKRDDRPRGGKTFGGGQRAARPFGDRPRPSREGDEARGERPRQARPRNDRGPRTSHAWRDHPRSEGADEPSERPYERRPAFGGRGEYRERPKADRDFRRDSDAVPAKAKKAGDRIAKLMSRAGLCSRRDAEEWIREGRVSVNGRIITSPALDVTAQDTVLVDGAPLPERERTRLFLYHKPKGLVTTHADPEGRPTVFDSLPEGLPRLISIGRLDFNTEGLLLLTNDGGLARVLELPDTGWLRRYRVRAHGAITQEQLDTLRKGIEVDGVKYGPIEAALERDQGANVWILFAIREGKNREVRNVLSHLGLEVNRLIRVSYGPFQLGELAEGGVEEVRSRMLRDQLGPRIAEAANAEFGLPTPESEPPRTDDAGEKPRKRAGVIADRKGRRVLVERSGSGGEADTDGPRRKPPSGYKGKRGRAPKDS